MRNLIILLALYLTMACSSENISAGKKMQSNESIEVVFGKPINSLLESYPSTFSTECLAPVDTCWYTVTNRFSSSSLPTVKIKGEDHTLLEVQNVGNLSIVISDRRGPEIRDISLSIRGLPDDSLHSEQKDFIYNILNKLISSNWEYLYPFSNPRIPGTEAHKIKKAKHIFGQYVLVHPWLDPRHEIPLEHWLQSGSTYHWYFHQDGVYLHTRVQSSKSHSEPEERGTYLIQIKLMDESGYWREHFSSEQLNDWQELLPELIEHYRHQRAALEKKARAAGIEIEEAYQDPPIKALSMSRGTQP